MNWLLWFAMIMEVACWSYKFDFPIGGHVSLSSKEIWETGPIGFVIKHNALDWTVYVSSMTKAIIEYLKVVRRALLMQCPSP